MSCVVEGLEKAILPYYKKCGMYDKYVDNRSLGETIENILENSSYLKDYSIDENTMCDDPGYGCGYVAVAWVEIDNSLHTQVYEWDTN